MDDTTLETNALLKENRVDSKMKSIAKITKQPIYYEFQLFCESSSLIECQ